MASSTSKSKPVRRSLSSSSSHNGPSANANNSDGESDIEEGQIKQRDRSPSPVRNNTAEPKSTTVKYDSARRDVNAGSNHSNAPNPTPTREPTHSRPEYRSWRDTRSRASNSHYAPYYPRNSTA